MTGNTKIIVSDESLGWKRIAEHTTSEHMATWDSDQEARSAITDMFGVVLPKGLQYDPDQGSITSLMDGQGNPRVSGVQYNPRQLAEAVGYLAAAPERFRQALFGGTHR